MATKSIDLCSQFKQTRQNLRDPIQCYDGLAPMFEMLNIMGFKQDGDDSNLAKLKTKGGDYTLAHGIATDSSIRAFIRIEGPEGFPGIRISCDPTQSNYEIGALKQAPKALHADQIQHPETVRKKLVAHLKQFDDLKSLVPDVSRLSAKYIHAATRVEPIQRVRAPIVSRQNPPSVVKKTDDKPQSNDPA